jgi:hypothetical protein
VSILSIHVTPILFILPIHVTPILFILPIHVPILPIHVSSFWSMPSGC